MHDKLSSKNKTNRIEFLLFKLGNNELALEVSKIREVINVPKLNKLPGSHKFVEGVVSFRGTTIPVIKLDLALGMGDLKNQGFIVITDYNDTQVGLLIDNVDKIVTIDGSELKEVPDSIPSHYLTHVVTINDQMKEVLDLEKIIDTVLLKTI